MKHRLLTTLTAALLALSAWAYNEQIGGIYYDLDRGEKTATVTSGKGKYQGDIIIPASFTYDGTTYSVTRIGSDAFSGCTSLTSITIPSSVTSIGNYAFYDCTSLTKVYIKDIAAWCGIVFKSSVDVYDKKFANPLYYAHHLYLNGEEVTELNIPSSVTRIMDATFCGYTGLTSINIPSSVTSISLWAFEGCTNLTSVTINSNDIVTHNYESRYKENISVANFFGPQVTTYILGDNVTSIGEEAFEDCTGLTSITIPNSVTSIGSDAFFGCTGLMSINIPSSVTSIEHGAFFRCTSLTSINIPSSVTSIGSGAFHACSGLTSITIDKDNKTYDSREDCNAIIETASNTLLAGCKATIIPSSVTSIGESAFSGCTGLTSINIPNSVTTIGDDAFRDCTGLTSITIPNSVTYIGELAFYECTSLTSINIPASVTSIEDHTFYGCTSLTSITIPNSVTSIGDYAFDGCTSLTSITIPASVTYIGELAFDECTSLTSINIPASVTIIHREAFRGCSGLTSITVDKDNEEYDSREDCNAIIATESNALIFGCMNTTIPKSVTNIWDDAFYGCTGLTSITIPNSVTDIDTRAFYDCTGLTNVTIGNSVTTIGWIAFGNCTGLTDIYALTTDPEEYNCNKSAFRDVPTSTCTLHVPKGCKEAYKAIEPWNRFENIVEDAKPSTEPADLNGDGAVNVGDVTTLVNMILGKTPMSDDADLNGDGAVNVGDVTTLVNRILGKE